MAKPELPRPCLMLVTDRRRVVALEPAVSAAVAGGVNLVQLREHDLFAGEMLSLARNLRAITRGSALLLVNDRLDVALASGADGVHLPEGGMPVTEARWIAGPDLLIGRSVHSVEGAVAAAEAGVDYLVVGTIYPSASHPGGATAGPGLIAEVAAAVRVPIIAIGGITPENVRTVLQAGAAGAAVITAFLDAGDVAHAAQQFHAQMLGPH